MTAKLSPDISIYSWCSANAWRAAWIHSGLKVLGEPGGQGMARYTSVSADQCVSSSPKMAMSMGKGLLASSVMPRIFSRVRWITGSCFLARSTTFIIQQSTPTGR
jgi:hypothetical protein